MTSESAFTNPASRSLDAGRAYVRAVLEMLGDSDPLEVLRASPDALRDAVAGRSAAALHTPEAPGKWCAQEVLGHLADSELVWGYRLRMALAQDRPRLEGYDQDAWALRLRYGDGDADRALTRFAVLREANLELLQAASAEELARVALHGERGEESVEHMIRLYAGHDLVHRRQLARILDAAPA